MKPTRILISALMGLVLCGSIQFSIFFVACLIGNIADLLEEKVDSLAGKIADLQKTKQFSEQENRP